MTSRPPRGARSRLLRAALRASLRSLERGADGAHSVFAFNSIPPGKNGSTKTVYLDRAGAEQKAREFISGARSAAEIAGRQVVLLAMARYADETALAQSQRSFHTLSPGRQLPFSGEVIDQLDAICAEAPRPRARPRPSAARAAGGRARQARVDQAWLEQQYEGLEAMSPEQRRAVLAEHEQRFGPYGGQRWQLEQRIRDLAEAKQTAEAHGADQQDEKREV